MSGSPNRDHGARARWFERQLRRESEAREAEAEARKAAEAAARLREVRPPPDDDDEDPILLQRQTLGAGDQADERISHGRATMGRSFVDAFSLPEDEGPVELPATLTPPSTYRSPYAETATENGTVLDTESLRSTIQTLHSQVDIERRRRAELEQQLAYAKRQLQQCSAEQHAVQELQGEAVMEDNESEVAKLELRAERMRKLWDKSRADVRRLEEEIVQRDEVIGELRREIASQVLEAQRREAQQQEVQQQAPQQQAPQQQAPQQQALQQQAPQQQAPQQQAPQQQAPQQQAPQQQDPQPQQSQKRAASNMLNNRAPATQGRSRRRSSNMSLSRNAAGVEIIRGENAYAVSGGPALALLRTL